MLYLGIIKFELRNFKSGDEMNKDYAKKWITEVKVDGQEYLDEFTKKQRAIKHLEDFETGCIIEYNKNNHRCKIIFEK